MYKPGDAICYLPNNDVNNAAPEPGAGVLGIVTIGQERKAGSFQVVLMRNGLKLSIYPTDVIPVTIDLIDAVVSVKVAELKAKIESVEFLLEEAKNCVKDVKIEEDIHQMLDADDSVTLMDLKNMIIKNSGLNEKIAGIVSALHS